MKKLLSLLLSMILVVSMFAGCAAKAPEEKSSEGSSSAAAQKKIAIVLDKVGTQPFLLGMINGLKDSSKKYNFELITAECADAAAYEENMRSLIAEGVDMIIGGGWQAGEAIAKIATEFPEEADYALIDSLVDAKNVKCINYNENESAYLVGMIAAMATEDKDMTFGCINVNEGAGSWKWRWGYMEGVKSAKPDAKFLFNYVGSFNDPAKAKEFALQQNAQGAKFILSCAAGGDSGTFEAAKEKSFLTAGQDVDLTSPDSPQIATCQIKDTYKTLTYLMDLYFTEGKWNTENETWGVKEGTIGATHITHPGAGKVPAGLTEDEIAKIKAAADDIASGKLNLTVPDEASYGKK